MDVQKKVFKAQLEIASETAMPVVIHCRDTEEETYKILTEVFI